MHALYYTTPLSIDKAAHSVRDSECTQQAVLDKLPYAGRYSRPEVRQHAKQMLLSHSSVTVCSKLHSAPYQ